MSLKECVPKLQKQWPIFHQDLKNVLGLRTCLAFLEQSTMKAVAEIPFSTPCVILYRSICLCSMFITSIRRGTWNCMPTMSSQKLLSRWLHLKYKKLHSTANKTEKSVVKLNVNKQEMILASSSKFLFVMTSIKVRLSSLWYSVSGRVRLLVNIELQS